MGLGGVVLAIAAGALPAPDCLRVAVAAPAGAIAVRRDFTAADCGPGVRTVFGYDAVGRVARTRDALAPGDVVRAPPAVALSAVRPGDRITLQVQVGPVRVERQVEVIRPARAGERVVVRGDDGRVFTAPAPGAGT